MFNSVRSSFLAFVISALPPTVVIGQVKAQDCFFGSDMEDGVIPSGWDIGPTVERQTEDGTGLGEFVPAWTVGNADQANTGGFFPVTDIPIGNLFAMANDDAPPCNCAMTEVMLTTPSIDLGGRTGVAMECRVFHDQALGGGTAEVQASVNGGTWMTLVTIPPLSSDWQDIFVDLSAFDGISDLRLRFTWSDNGNWASGFALDDVCVRERYAKDLSVLQVHANDPSVSPFVTGDQSLKYRLLPLAQSAAMTVAVEVMNSGTDVLEEVEVTAFLHLNGVDHGPYSGSAASALAPGERTLMIIPTDWVPDGTGEVDVMVSAQSTSGEDDVNDNSGLYIMEITGPGWVGRYGAMASDGGVLQGRVGGQQNFIAANRLELVNGGTAPRGISVVFEPGTEADEQVRAILLDENLAFVDTSSRLTLGDAQLEMIALGEPLYFPFDQPQTLEAADYFVGIQHLDGPGEVFIGTSGNGTVGASVMLEGVNFDATYIRSTPMVRLHFDEVGVGVSEIHRPDEVLMSIHPSPMSSNGWLDLTLEQGSTLRYSILDMTGRMIHEQGPRYFPAGKHRIELNVSGSAEGTYIFSLISQERPTSLRFQVLHR